MKYPLRYSIIPLFTSLFILASCGEKPESVDGDNGVVMAEPSQIYEEVKPEKPAQKVAPKKSDNPEMRLFRTSHIFGPIIGYQYVSKRFVFDQSIGFGAGIGNSNAGLFLMPDFRLGLSIGTVVLQ